MLCRKPVTSVLRKTKVDQHRVDQELCKRNLLQLSCEREANFRYQSHDSVPRPQADLKTCFEKLL